MSCSDSFHLVHVLWAVKIPCLFWHSVEDFLDTLSTVTHGPVCSPLWVIVGTVFSPPLYIALWMVREDSGVGGGQHRGSWDNGQSFYNTWARLSLLRFKYFIPGWWEVYSIPMEKFLWASDCFPNSVCGPTAFVPIRKSP